MSDYLHIEAGKQYVTREGKVSGPLREGIMPGQFAWSCNHLHASWEDGGRHPSRNKMLDLVSEYVEGGSDE
jgi:hypothetical protein